MRTKQIMLSIIWNGVIANIIFAMEQQGIEQKEILTIMAMRRNISAQLHKWT